MPLQHTLESSFRHADQKLLQWLRGMPSPGQSGAGVACKGITCWLHGEAQHRCAGHSRCSQLGEQALLRIIPPPGRRARAQQRLHGHGCACAARRGSGGQRGRQPRCAVPGGPGGGPHCGAPCVRAGAGRQAGDAADTGGAGQGGGIARQSAPQWGWLAGACCVCRGGRSCLLPCARALRKQCHHACVHHNTSSDPPGWLPYTGWRLGGRRPRLRRAGGQPGIWRLGVQGGGPATPARPRRQHRAVDAAVCRHQVSFTPLQLPLCCNVREHSEDRHLGGCCLCAYLYSQCCACASSGRTFLARSWRLVPMAHAHASGGLWRTRCLWTPTCRRWRWAPRTSSW